MDADFKLPNLRQDYAAYTADDHAVWGILYQRQMEVLPPLASRGYLDGIQKVNFTAERIPDYEETNRILRELTGWEIFVVPGLIPNRPFFELMRDRKFCASTWLRQREQLDYLEEPDMFHDIFGHVPMLTDPNVCNFLSELARIALNHIDDEQAIEFIARLYWYTIEFGLIQENGQTKIFGAGILSSKGESLYCLGPEPRRVPYDVRDILRTPYIKEHYQEQYWVLESFDQLLGSIPDIERILEEELINQPV